jgi:hypothetical protein
MVPLLRYDAWYGSNPTQRNGTCARSTEERESLQSRDPGLGDWEMDADNGRRASHSYTLLYWPGRAYILQHSLLCRYLTSAAFQGRRPWRESLDTLLILLLLRHTSVAYISYLQYLSLHNSPTAGVDTSSVHAENERRSTTSKKSFQQAYFPERERRSATTDSASLTTEKNPHLHILRECARTDGIKSQKGATRRPNARPGKVRAEN